MAKVFFSYSHKDESLRDEMEKHLSVLKRQGLIETWHDRRIGAGDDFGHEISSNLEAADIILLLISSDFLNSDYCYDVELKRSMEKHERGETTVIPVILRPCSWHGTIFGKLLAATIDGKPVTKFPTLDDGFLEVTNAIESVVRKIQSQMVPETKTANMQEAFSRPSVVATPRSSNLRIKRQFSDHDQDVFIEGAFNFICNYFEESLLELGRRSIGIQTKGTRIDLNHFSAKIYRDGKLIAGCRIWYGGRASFAGGILYSSNADSNSDSSYNESISSDNDGYSQYLKPLGMASYGNTPSKQLTEEGAAEYLWSLLIRPLQR
jgi:TIR domain